MITDSSKFDKEVIRKLKDEITILNKQYKFNEYCINHLKAEIRLLRDTLTKIESASKEDLYQHEEMNKTLNMQLENGHHMSHNGEEIHYVGKNNHVSITEMKRKH